MSAALLAAADVTRLVIEYCAYAAVIVVGIAVLLLLRRAGKLPKHAELQKQIAALGEELAAFPADAPALSGYAFYRRAAKLTGKADKLQRVTAEMAEKERDGDISAAAGLLESARESVAMYRFGKRERTDTEGFSEAAEKAQAAAKILGAILTRDEGIKARREKKS